MWSVVRERPGSRHTLLTRLQKEQERLGMAKHPSQRDLLDKHVADITGLTYCVETQHAVFLLSTNGKLFLAPLGDHIKHVLDFATGTPRPGYYWLLSSPCADTIC